jgi:hypothetical protein
MRKLSILLVAIGFIIFFAGLLGGIWPFSTAISTALWVLGLIYSEYGKRKQEKRDLVLLGGQKRIIKHQKETKKEVKEIKDVLDKEFTSKRILERVRRSLKGVLSTEELVEEFDSPLNAVLIYKWGEPEQKLIRDGLAKLGFKDIASGIKILPPSRMPDPPLKNRRDIEKWLRQNLLDHLPRSHKYAIVFAQLIDLRKVYTTKYAPQDWADRFRGYTILDKLSWEELFPMKILRKLVTKKTHVSFEELILEYFPFSFLISRFLSDKDLDRVLPQRETIIQEIRRVFNLDSVTLMDFADMNEEELSQVIAKLKISNSKQIARGMVNEARVWKSFLKRI